MSEKQGLNVGYACGYTADLVREKDKIQNGTFIWARDTRKLYLKFDDIITSITRQPSRRTNCINCGAVLPVPEKYSAIIRCEYCGSVQDIDDDILVGIDPLYNRDKDNPISKLINKMQENISQISDEKGEE